MSSEEDELNLDIVDLSLPARAAGHAEHLVRKVLEEAEQAEHLVRKVWEEAWKVSFLSMNFVRYSKLLTLNNVILNN